jgi:tetratricopeptide (TPR) repeat protein
MSEKNPGEFLAEELVKSNKLTEAEFLYRRLSAANPSEARLQIRLSLVCWYQGKYETAEEILLNLIKENPNNTDALNNLGVMRHLAHSLESAIELFARVLEIDPAYENVSFNLGNVYAEMEDFENAISSYLSELSIQPRKFEVYMNLADVLRRKGELKKALEAYDSALRVKESPLVYRNKAIIMRDSGRIDEAVYLFKKAIRIKEDYTEARMDLAMTLMSDNHMQAAIECQKILEYKPKDAAAIMLLGQCFYLASKISEASRIFEQILASDPGNEEAIVNLSACYIEDFKFDKASRLLRQCLNRNPINPIVLYNIGRIFQLENNYAEAASFFITALRLEPAYSDALNNLGVCYYELGHLSAAIDTLKWLCHIRPCWSTGRLNLANALEKSGYLEQAIDQLEHALELDPLNVDARHNLGHLYHLQGKLEQAALNYRKALRVDAQYHLSRYNLSHIYLLKGFYARGLRYYESRFRIKNPITPIAQPKSKLWSGCLSPKDNLLLIVAEQGLGDFMQFARYATYLKRFGIHTKICCHIELHSLVIDSGLDNNPLTPEQGCSVIEGEWIPLLSIPLILGVRPGRPLVLERYLHASKDKSREWQLEFAAIKKPVVAINWQGNPEAEMGLLKGRSMPLSLFERIAANINCKLVSIQKGFAAKQLDHCSFKESFVSFQPRITSSKDLSDTAAIIVNCDLVITTDTSMAHLAGGLGVPVWLLLSKSHDWRWGQQEGATFWYPSMRIFRQDNTASWPPVLTRVEADLRSFCTQNNKYLRRTC